MPRDPRTSSIPEAPPTEFTKVKRADVLPYYLNKHLVPKIPEIAPDLIPDTYAKFDRDKLVASQPLPEVIPAFTGLQRKVAEIRLNRIQKQIEGANVLRNAARSIARDQGGASFTEKYRPTTYRQKRAYRRLNKFNRQMHIRRNVTTAIEGTYPPEGKLENGWSVKPDFHRHKGNRSFKEWMNDSRNERVHKRIGRQIARRQKKFEKIYKSQDPSRAKLVRLSTHRDKLALKSEALRRAKEEGRQTKLEERLHRTVRKLSPSRKTSPAPKDHSEDPTQPL